MSRAKTRAIIGDIHGCLSELKELHEVLKAQGIEDYYHLGDMIDRGPDSPGVVRYCRVNGFRGVMGNHESSLLALIDRSKSPHFQASKLPVEKLARWDIARALSSKDIQYIRSLPKLHVFDDLKIVLVHGGLWPNRSLWEQDRSILYLQVIHPNKPGEVRWTRRPGLYTLEESRAEGFSPWQELYDGEEEVVYGHSVFAKPSFQKSTLGIDTGCVYGGYLTAYVLPDRRFVQVKAHRAYASHTKDDSY
jgi:predicted phosphodiesterase